MRENFLGEDELMGLIHSLCASPTLLGSILSFKEVAIVDVGVVGFLLGFPVIFESIFSWQGNISPYKAKLQHFKAFEGMNMFEAISKQCNESLSSFFLIIIRCFKCGIGTAVMHSVLSLSFGTAIFCDDVLL